MGSQVHGGSAACRAAQSQRFWGTRRWPTQQLQGVVAIGEAASPGGFKPPPSWGKRMRLCKGPASHVKPPPCRSQEIYGIKGDGPQPGLVHLTLDLRGTGGRAAQVGAGRAAAVATGGASGARANLGACTVRLTRAGRLPYALSCSHLSWREGDRGTQGWDGCRAGVVSWAALATQASPGARLEAVVACASNLALYLIAVPLLAGEEAPLALRGEAGAGPGSRAASGWCATRLQTACLQAQRRAGQLSPRWACLPGRSRRRGRWGRARGQCSRGWWPRRAPGWRRWRTLGWLRARGSRRRVHCSRRRAPLPAAPAARASRGGELRASKAPWI